MDKNKDIKIKVIQYLNGELDNSEIHKIISWKNASKENNDFYCNIKTLLQAANIHFNPYQFNSDLAWNTFKNKSLNSVTEKEGKTIEFKKFYNYLFRIAALLIIVFTIGYITYDLTIAYKRQKIEYAQTFVPNSQTMHLFLLF